MTQTSAGQHLNQIVGFRLVTQDLSRLTSFYRDILGCSVVGAVYPIGHEEMTLLTLTGGGVRQMLSLGEQSLALDQFEVAGRAYPPDSNAASLWFQHLALVVTDIAAAHARLGNTAPISLDGPQQLPASSGGVIAFKFRDPDGHPLELLQFPYGDVPQAWRGQTASRKQIELGIDHSAISVADADASARFYQGIGLTTGTRTLNEGPAQQRLDDLRDVVVDVVPMQPASAPPHLELLCYRTPQGATGTKLRANDVAATRIVWHGSRIELVTDPDGHLHQIEA